MTREEAIKTLKGEAWLCCAEKWNEALEMAIKALQEPSGDTVSLETFKQVMWERDIAIEQLHELGYELGQKIETKSPCDLCRYNPPSSADGKPCTMCPSEGRTE